MKLLNLFKMLILFDVNGVFCFKTRDEADLANVHKRDIIRGPNYWMVLRPGLRQMLKELAHEHTLGIFSSTTFKNNNLVVKVLEEDGPLFDIKAYREYTQLDPGFASTDSVKDFDTVKPLKTIWRHPFFNSNRMWSSDNTLLVDDSVLKTRINPPSNVLVVKEFTRQSYLEGGHTSELKCSIDIALTNLLLKRVHVGPSSSSIGKSDLPDLAPIPSSYPTTSGAIV